ncbi:MAG: hypothetical protein U9R42_06145, partial [Bacteroidota bacterium]|nr:hypothetical protein [Bacteroidota bacterium]
MAELSEILSGLKTIESNPNNNTFIDLMKNIAGDPNDAINPEDDPNSIYGKIVEVYNGMVDARSSDEEITAALSKIDGLTASATSVGSSDPASATLDGSVIRIQIPSGKDGIDGQTPTVALTVSNGILKYQVDVDPVVDIANLNTIVDGVVTTNVSVAAVNSSITDFTDVTVPAKIIEIAGVTDTKKAEIDAHAADKVLEYNDNHDIKIADVQAVASQVHTSVADAAGYASSSLDNKNATASDLAQVTLAADQVAIDKDDIIAFKDNVRVDHDRVEAWHEDVMFTKETVNILLRRVMNYANLPVEGVTGTTYVVIEDETQDPVGETHGYRWNPVSKEYMRYLSGSAEGENKYTDADLAFVDKDEVLSTVATTLPTAINELVAKEGVADGIATLDSAGTIPPNQLPSYVDDVLEVATYAELPITGETGKIYVVVADETSNGDTSSYRWTGTVYASVSSTLNGADIKALYEAEPDTNEYNDAEKTKVSHISITQAVDLDAIETKQGSAILSTTATSLSDAINEHESDIGSMALSTAATDLTASINEVHSEIDDHLADTVDAHDASAISFVADGDILATDVQTAIVEVRDAADTKLDLKLDKTGGTISSDLTVNGNFTVNGTTTTVNTEVTTTDNIVILNDGEVGAGVTAGSAGIQIDRGTATDYEFKFDEADDSFKIGEVGSLQK